MKAIYWLLFIALIMGAICMNEYEIRANLHEKIIIVMILVLSFIEYGRKP